MKTDFSAQIFEIIASLTEDHDTAVGPDTSLIGDGRVLDSIKLVELCVQLEDLASAHGFEFDWTSETAMSRSRSMFRTAGSLAAAFAEQQGESA